jgi:hypothetical protein
MGATSCANIGIRDDATFEDVENFQAFLIVDPQDPSVITGNTNTTTIFIDDLGKYSTPLCIENFKQHSNYYSVCTLFSSLFPSLTQNISEICSMIMEMSLPV